MTKIEFMGELVHIVHGRETFAGDKPALRMLFNNMSDSYCKDGIITPSQYERWLLTERELNRLIRSAKGL